MPSLTIDLSEETAADFAALPPAGQAELTRRVRAFVHASLTRPASQKENAPNYETEDPEGAAWWNSLTPQEQEHHKAKIKQSFADIDAGRTHPAEEVYARIRAKYADCVPAVTK